MKKIVDLFYENRDEKYAAFQAMLTPGISAEKFIGVRVPVLRKIAANFAKDPDHEEFMQELPHEYYEENILHGFLIGLEKDYNKCMEELEVFLPYVDNWAVSDTILPKVFKKHREELMEKILVWCKSDKTYTIRFGVDMLMTHYLDEDFKAEYLDIAAAIQSEEYYVNMMLAWYYATALAKQWDAAIPYITEGRLGKWVNNKTIQKARESFRVSAEHKEYLKQYKRK